MLNVDTVVNIALALMGIAITFITSWSLFVAKGYKDDIKALQTTDSTLSEKLSAIQLLVAGKYITRDEFVLALDRQTGTLLTAITQVRSEQSRVEKAAQSNRG